MHIVEARAVAIIRHSSRLCATLQQKIPQCNKLQYYTVHIAGRAHTGCVCVAVCGRAGQCVAVCCSVLWCVAVYHSVLQCVVELGSVLHVLQCAVVCCGVPQCVAVCVAVCCSVLQCLTKAMRASAASHSYKHTTTHAHRNTLNQTANCKLQHTDPECKSTSAACPSCK